MRNSSGDFTWPLKYYFLRYTAPKSMLIKHDIPTVTKCWHKAGIMLGHRLRRWPNINLVLGQFFIHCIENIFFLTFSQILISQTDTESLNLPIGYIKVLLTVHMSTLTYWSFWFLYFFCTFFYAVRIGYAFGCHYYPMNLDSNPVPPDSESTTLPMSYPGARIYIQIQSQICLIINIINK